MEKCWILCVFRTPSLRFIFDLILFHPLTNLINRNSSNKRFKKNYGKTRLDRRWGGKKKLNSRNAGLTISSLYRQFHLRLPLPVIYSKVARFEVFHNWSHSRDIFHFAWSISCSIAFLSKNGWVEKLVLVTDQASWHLLAREIWSIDNDNADTRL